MRMLMLAAFGIALAGCGPSPQQIAEQMRDNELAREAERVRREREDSFYPNPRQQVTVKFAAEAASNDPHNTFVRLISLRRNSPNDSHYDFCAESFRRNMAGYVDQVRWIFGEYRGDANVRVTATGNAALALCQTKIRGNPITNSPLRLSDGWHRPAIIAAR